jgi:hypothetical protein
MGLAPRTSNESEETKVKTRLSLTQRAVLVAGALVSGGARERALA